MMTKPFKYIFFIIFEIILLIIIILLGNKVFNLIKEKNKIPNLVSVINRDDIIFDNTDNKLKYYYEHKPNIKIIDSPEWLDYKANYTINSDRLNERYNYEIQRDKNTFRIITIGDSFTFGLFVNTERNFTEVLEEYLNTSAYCKNYKNFEVINLGEYGYDVEYILNRFRLRGIKYHPDLVIWLLNETDFTKINEIIFPLNNQLIANGIPAFNPKSGEYPSIKKAEEEFNKTYGENYIINYQKKALFSLSDFYNGKLVIFYFPGMPKIYLDIITDFVKLNTANFKFQQLFEYGNNKQYQLLDRHPNIEGHKMIAKGIYDYLLSSVLKGCVVKN